MSYALIFPGQGAQEVGMGKDLFDNFRVAKETFLSADEALGFKLSQTIFQGPEQELQKTAFTQPAILTMSIAAYRVLVEMMGKTPEPAFVAGHSLGEYTSLVASGSISLEEGVRLVHLRGELMQEAVPIGEGSMAAILGLDKDSVISICEEVSGERVCDAANFNSPGQVVISGHTDMVEEAVRLASEKGAKRAVKLKVSAPFHSSLMKSVSMKLREAALLCQWREPYCPVVANATARPEHEVETIIEALVEQTYKPVLWSGSVEYMGLQGVDTFYEIGPGRVLSGLVRKCLKGVNVHAAGDISGLEQMVQLMEGNDG